MRKIFGTDSNLFKLLTMLMELAEINILFLICSLPVVTMGAACTAMYESLYEMHRFGEGCFSAGRFLKKFKQSLKCAVPVWIVGMIAFAALLFSGMSACGMTKGIMRIFLGGIYVVFGFMVCGIMQFIFFFLSRTQEWHREYLKDSFLLALAKFYWVIFSAGMSVSPAVVLMMPGNLLLRILPLILLFWIACPAYVCVGIFKKIFEPLYPELFEE